MKTLTTQQCSAWLGARGIVRAPYSKERCPTLYVEQFRLYDSTVRAGYLAQILIDGLEKFDTALLEFTDWSPYYPEEMAVVTTLRTAHGDQGLLIDTPGHLFGTEERDLLAGLFALAMTYHWTAYLYFDDHTTVLCWEGDILDFWTSNPKHLQTMREAFQRPADPAG